MSREDRREVGRTETSCPRPRTGQGSSSQARQAQGGSWWDINVEIRLTFLPGWEASLLFIILHHISQTLLNIFHHLSNLWRTFRLVYWWNIYQSFTWYKKQTLSKSTYYRCLSYIDKDDLSRWPLNTANWPSVIFILSISSRCVLSSFSPYHHWLSISWMPLGNCLGVCIFVTFQTIWTTFNTKEIFRYINK